MFTAPARRITLSVSLAVFTLCFLAGCPLKKIPGPDPTEYIYDLSGTGSLVMGDGSSYPLSFALSQSSWPDFHLPSSFDSYLRIYAYFEGSPLCLFIQLEKGDSRWSAKKSSSKPYCHIAYGPYPDGLISGTPYKMDASGMKVSSASGNSDIITALSFTSKAIKAFEPHVAGYSGSVSSVTVNLKFSAPLGYGFVGHASSMTADQARFMDTRSRLAAVSAEIDSGLRLDPAAWAPQLVASLTSGLSDPLAKLKVIHDWIAENIYYDKWWYETYYLLDPASANGDEFVDKSPCAVLKSRKTVCGGYSLLLWYLGKFAGLRAEVVRGYTRSLSEPGKRADHTWNIMSVNGSVYHIDATADSLNSYSISREWLKADARAEWFLPPPDLFTMWRYPYELAHRYPSQEADDTAFYASIPPIGIMTAGSYLSKAFLEKGFTLGPGAQSLASTEGLLEIPFSIPSGGGMTLRADVLHNSGDASADSHESFVERSGQEARIVAIARDAGYRAIRLWLSESGQWAFLGQFILKGGNASSQEAAFPRHLDNYCALGALLQAPLRDNLKAGTSAIFSLSAPGANAFYFGSAAMGWQSFSASAEAFNGNVILPDQTGSFYVGATVEGSSYSLLEYSLGP